MVFRRSDMVGDGPWNASPLKEDYLDDPRGTKPHKRKHLFSNLGSPESQSKLLQLTLSQPDAQPVGRVSPGIRVVRWIGWGQFLCHEEPMKLTFGAMRGQRCVREDESHPQEHLKDER